MSIRTAARARMLAGLVTVALVPTAAATAATAAVAAPPTARVSQDTQGGDADGPSAAPALSDDGRFVAFASDAADLVPGDGNGARDVFVRDLATGRTQRVSVDAAGGDADGSSDAPALSDDGRVVAFTSSAGDLVAGDGNGLADVFVRDLAAGTTVRVSVDRAGGDADATSGEPALDATGTVVAFTSLASDLVRQDGNGLADVFVRDLATGRTQRVSVDTAGGDAGGASAQPSVSDDGRRVGFASFALDLVPGDGGHDLALFVRDRVRGTTEKASVTPGGGQEAWSQGVLSGDGRHVAFATVSPDPPATRHPGHVWWRDLDTGVTVAVDRDMDGGPPERLSVSRSPAISDDGRFVAFTSDAADLVPGDHNGNDDVFVRDVERSTTARASSGAAADPSGPSGDAAISGDGTVVAFASAAPDVVAGDGNDASDVFARPRPRPVPVPLPVVGVGDVTVVEGDAGGVTAWFSLTLSRPAAHTVRVAWKTADGTAVAPADYSSAAGTATFEPGATITLLKVAVAPDAVDEAHERFQVRLVGAAGPAVLGRRTGTGTVRDDDPGGGAPVLTVGDATVVEGDDGTTQATFTVRLSRPATSDVVVSFATPPGGTATPADDGDPDTEGDYVGYFHGPTARIPAGAVDTTIGVVVVGDFDPERVEQFPLTVTVQQGDGIVVGDPTGTGTIVDDDG